MENLTQIIEEQIILGLKEDEKEKVWFYDDEDLPENYPGRFITYRLCNCPYPYEIRCDNCLIVNDYPEGELICIWLEIIEQVEREISEYFEECEMNDRGLYKDELGEYQYLDY